jgi:glycosyltransferase involved in cell wall biosynthesis
VQRPLSQGLRSAHVNVKLAQAAWNPLFCESAMRAAIVHYWLLGMRGGERVVEALCRMLPSADIYTLFYDPDRVSAVIRSHKVTASFLNPLRRWYRATLPLMPAALEGFDLRDYDVVISSESGPAKGVLTRSDARHICYCHTPMRYLWELYPAYLNEWTNSRLKRAVFRPTAHYLRLWDYASAARVDQFVANSENVRRRILKTYRRDADVVYPPVAVETFRFADPAEYFLIVSELVAYKQIDCAVRVFSRAGRALKIVGDGPEYRSLRRTGAGCVEFCGRVTDSDLRDLYAHCRALVLPGEEDFGIAAVEAMASGKPVVALARGGALESVPPGGGVLYPEPTDDGLNTALQRFDDICATINPAHLQAWAGNFSEAVFHRRMQAIIGSGTTTAAVPFAQP